MPTMPTRDASRNLNAPAVVRLESAGTRAVHGLRMLWALATEPDGTTDPVLAVLVAEVALFAVDHGRSPAMLREAGPLYEAVLVRHRAFERLDREGRLDGGTVVDLASYRAARARKAAS